MTAVVVEDQADTHLTYLEAGDAHALCRLAGVARGRGEEVFATPLPRARAEPGNRAVGPGSVVWVDLDGADADGLREIERLRPHLWSPRAPASTSTGAWPRSSSRRGWKSSTEGCATA